MPVRVLCQRHWRQCVNLLCCCMVCRELVMRRRLLVWVMWTPPLLASVLAQVRMSLQGCAVCCRLAPRAIGQGMEAAVMTYCCTGASECIAPGMQCVKRLTPSLSHTVPVWFACSTALRPPTTQLATPCSTPPGRSSSRACWIKQQQQQPSACGGLLRQQPA